MAIKILKEAPLQLDEVTQHEWKCVNCETHFEFDSNDGELVNNKQFIRIECPHCLLDAIIHRYPLTEEEQLAMMAKMPHAQ